MPNAASAGIRRHRWQNIVIWIFFLNRGSTKHYLDSGSVPHSAIGKKQTFHLLVASRKPASKHKHIVATMQTQVQVVFESAQQHFVHGDIT